jgi:hypothetical protein
VAISAVVDSGAFGCCLPLRDATRLGIPQQALAQAGQLVVADDRTVPYLETTLTTRAQVVFQQTPAAAPRPWGPVFELQPAFIEDGSRLLGQRDFFHRFEITFRRGRTPPTFTLRY